MIPSGRRSVPSVMKKLLPKLAPRSHTMLDNVKSFSLGPDGSHETLGEIASWMEGSSGCSLGPHNQVQSSLKSVRMHLAQLDSQLEALSRVGPMLPDGYRS